MRLLSVALFLVYAWQVLGQTGHHNQSTFPFNPPSFPLAVRSTYFNVWLQQGQSSQVRPFEATPQAWFGLNTGWYASVVVDDKEYRLLGQYNDTESTPNQTLAEFTATRTTFIMTAGGMQFNMSFLSPIEARNFTLLSLPFLYLCVSAQSMDGIAHRVHLYSDIEGGLIAGDTSDTITWQTEETDDASQYVILSMQLQDQERFVETDLLARDSTAYYAFKKINGTTTSWSISSRDNTRGIFVSNPSSGTLNTQADRNFRAALISANESDTPVLGIAVDWGNITTTPEPAVWALGAVRDPSVQYRTPENDLENRRPYFMSTFSSVVDAIEFFLDDFPRARTSAQMLDDQIIGVAEVISPDYGALVSLSARQVMGSMDITLPEPADDGSWNNTDVRIFMRNVGRIGSDSGTGRSINTVDALYPAFPAFLYLNPEIGRYLLAPLLEFQNSPSYLLEYAATNIGTTYPNAVADGINDLHIYGIDASASMIIMALGYSLASGNGTLLHDHYNLLHNWADYLVNNSVSFTNQSSGDFSTNSDFVSDNQANLLLKGIIAISAMAKIAEVSGNVTDQERFNNSATTAMERWQNEALSSSYVDFILNDSNSNGMMYNLYADKLLGLGVVPQTVYDVSTMYYQNRSDTFEFGYALTGSPGQNTTTHWMMFAAGAESDPDTQQLFISKVYEYASNNLNDQPFSSHYDPDTGLRFSSGLGVNTPAVGSIFALLALKCGSTTNQPISFSSDETRSGSTGSSPGVIVGAVIGSVLGSCVIAFSVFYWIRRRRNRKLQDALPRPQTFWPVPSRGPESGFSALTNSSAHLSKGELIFDKVQLRTEALSRSEAIMTESNDGGAGRGDAFRQQFESAGSTLTVSESIARLGENQINDVVVQVPTREEFDRLQQEVERLRQERHLSQGNSEAPPSYSDA
ncbi:hypothetical protein ACEPAG_11 [Sanghuangporus baumii]